MEGAEQQQRTVLAELFTGTWCKYCQGGEGAMDRLAKEYPRTKLTIIEWHNGDDYVTADNSGSEREDFYDPHMSFPTAYFDGTSRVVGGSEDPDNETVYNNYKSKIEERLAIPSPLVITSTGYIEGAKAVIAVEIKAIGDIGLSNLYAHFVLYNDHNETAYVDGREYRLRYTALKSVAEPISLSKGMGLAISKNFTLQVGWDRDKLGVVTFVQTHDRETHSETDLPPYYYTAEILQSNDFRYINVELKPDQTVTEVSIGGTANFNVVLKNTRNEADTYTLRLLKSLPQGWSANFCIDGTCYQSVASISLERQASKSINISVISASDAEMGAIGIVELIVTSSLMPEGKSSVVLKALTVSAPTPVVLECKSTYKTSVTLSWSRNTDANFLRYEIHKGTVQNFTISDNTLVTAITTQSKTSYDVTGLLPNTDYYFKIRVVNDYGYSDSEEVHAKTLLSPKGEVALPLTIWIVVIAMVAIPVIVIPIVLVKVMKGTKR
ncbi:MAG: fibronectin type III domain-containing protein [Candidatus Thermoplasmatota archaeon]|nr:fibronectin type III domain-containing protein [Candidatus Thermoplasmatota archaeon]